MATLGSLGPFDLATGDWMSYIEWAKLYFIANEITCAGWQRAMLLSSYGDATYCRIKDVLSPSLPTDVSFTEICTKMTAHLQPKPSEIVKLFRFNTRVCQPHETVATYVTQLKRLAEHCNFGGRTDRVNEISGITSCVV